MGRAVAGGDDLRARHGRATRSRRRGCGAFDFLEKPLARDRVLLVVKNALEWSDLQRENQRFRELVGDAPRMIGSSAGVPAGRAAGDAGGAIRCQRAALGRVRAPARSCWPRTSIARARLPSGPFVKVNCAAIPTELIESELFGHEKGAFTGAAALRRGKFELADGGTIFLDEVGDLHEASQAKLLRILQDGELQRVGGEQTIRVAARVISATNRRLDELVADGRFREDLYYRLSVVPIRVPALRERLQDIGELVRVLPRRVLRAQQLPAARRSIRTPSRCSSATLARQRPRAAERRRADGDPHARRSDHGRVRSRWRSAQPQSPRAATGLQEVRDAAERERIRQALDQTDWNVVGGGAAARHRAHGAAQADPRARPEAVALLPGA